MPTPVEVPKLGNTVEECLIRAGRNIRATPSPPATWSAKSKPTRRRSKSRLPSTARFSKSCLKRAPTSPSSRHLHIGEANESVCRSSTCSHRAPTPPAARRFPRRPTLAAEHDIAPPTTPGSGPNGRILESDLHGLEPARPQSPREDRPSLRESSPPPPNTRFTPPPTPPPSSPSAPNSSSPPTSTSTI